MNKKHHFLVLAGLSTAALLIIGLAVLYFIINTTVRGIIYDDIIGIAHRDKQLYANEIDGWFHSANSTVYTLASTLSALSYPQEFRGPGFRDFDRRDRDFIEIAEKLVRENPYIFNVFIGFADGSIINGAGFRPPPNGVWTSTSPPWFSAAVEAGEGVIVMTEPYWSQAAENFTAGIATWLPELNNVGAVVGLSVTLDDILNRIAHDPILGDGYRILATTTGEIIFHSNPLIAGDENINNLSDIPGANFLIESVCQGVTLADFYDYTMGYSYFVAAYLDAVGWILFDVIPVSAIESPITQNLNAIMMPLGFLFIAMYIFALFLFYYISKQRAEKTAMEKNLAQAANEAKTGFLARMSHEIRTPITAVLGISEIELQNPGLPPEIESSFAKIRSSADMLLGIVNGVLDLSKIEADKMELFCEEYEVADMINNIMLLHSEDITKKIKFGLHIDENIPTHLFGDSLRIEQIFSNLLSNSFKYTESGTVDFFWQYTDEGSDFKLLVTITDTGLGMTKEQIEALQGSEYTRFHEQKYRDISGTGLGMPIVYNLLKMMNADLKIESEVGKGTKITVHLPQKVSDKATVIGKETVSRLLNFEENIQSFGRKFKFIPEPMPYGSVLIVDDVEANLYVVKGLLAFYDLKIETCNSGYEAIEKVKQGAVYDIIFMDYLMPDLNGIETMDLIRSTGYNRPIVALTANALTGHAEEFIKSGFDGFVSKPVQTKHLNAVLNKFIRDKQPPEVIESANLYNTTYAGDDDGLQATLQREFIVSHSNTFAKLSDAIKTGDIKNAHILAHNLKSVAALIHETALSKAAEQAEHLLAAGNTLPENMLSVLETEMNRALEKIRAKT